MAQDGDHRAHEIFNAQRGYAPTVAATGHRERGAKLRALLRVLLARRADIHAALLADLRKAPEETDITEIVPTAAELRHALRNLRRWMQPHPVRRTAVTVAARAHIRHEPKGVVLIIAPWNYPLNLTLGPLVAAVAAGNCAIIKPSEVAPRTAALTAELLSEVFAEREVAVAGGGPEIGEALLELPFDHFFFTGGAAVGRRVLRAAAEHLSTSTLELGGKSPAIVDETAPLAGTARKLVWGKFLNAGQTCVAPDYVLVQANRFEALVASLRQSIAARYGSSAADRRRTRDFTRIVSDRHLQRLESLLEDAVRSGATIAAGGDLDAADRYLSPTLLTGVAPDSAIMREEIFGPILPIVPYRHLDEAVAFINARPTPLSLYIFSTSRRSVQRVLASVPAGTSAVNEVLLQFGHVRLPFGGVAESGQGRGHGVHGFRELSNQRAVLHQGRLSVPQLLAPPYNGRVRRMLEVALRVI